VGRVRGTDPLSKVVCGWESLETILAEPNIRELLTGYWRELSPIKHIPLDIDWPRIFAWEREFLFRVWTCRVDGTLAGFITFLVQPHFLHKTTLTAVDHGHYLAPAFRGNGMVGMRMWRSAERALKELGVQMAFIHDNALRPLSPFFLAIGARPFSSMWLLDLRDENHH
jgi:hypothetical protein